jgi:hypothetical protein
MIRSRTVTTAAEWQAAVQTDVQSEDGPAEREIGAVGRPDVAPQRGQT